jgi:hypothetical protein
MKVAKKAASTSSGILTPKRLIFFSPFFPFFKGSLPFSYKIIYSEENKTGNFQPARFPYTKSQDFANDKKSPRRGTKGKVSIETDPPQWN